MLDIKNKIRIYIFLSITLTEVVTQRIQKKKMPLQEQLKDGIRNRAHRTKKKNLETKKLETEKLDERYQQNPKARVHRRKKGTGDYGNADEGQPWVVQTTTEVKS